MRKLLIVVLGALMVLAFKPDAAEASTAVAVVDLNIRSGPSARHNRLGVIPAGAAVHLHGCQRGWCRINFRGIEGHASARYLDTTVAVGPRRPAYRHYGYVAPRIVVPSPRFHTRVYRPHRVHRGHRVHRQRFDKPRRADRHRRVSPRRHHRRGGWRGGRSGGWGGGIRHGQPGSGR